MNKQDFIKKISEILEFEGELTYDSKLDDIEEWDSIAVISTVAFLDSIGKKVTVNDLKEIKTVKMLAELAGIDE